MRARVGTFVVMEAHGVSLRGFYHGTLRASHKRLNRVCIHAFLLGDKAQGSSEMCHAHAPLTLGHNLRENQICISTRKMPVDQLAIFTQLREALPIQVLVSITTERIEGCLRSRADRID
jgi:hypothetical protein